MFEDNQRLILAVQSDRLPGVTRTVTAALKPLEEQDMVKTLYDAGLWLGPRKQLEDMPGFRQIIPYIALSVNGKIIKYTRTPAGGEERLHGKVSIGLGGHIDLEDICFEGGSIRLEETLEAAAAREILEEIGPVEIISKTWVGLLFSNNNPVDFVHIGAAAVWELAEVPNGIAEDAIGEVTLSSINDLLRCEPERMETWSISLLNHLARI